MTIIDLPSIQAGTGPARLFDMIPGRSKAAFTDWLESRPAVFREETEVVAMDGFTGCRTAAAEAVPQTTTVMEPFYVVALARDGLDGCQRRLQQTIHHRHGRKGDPLPGVHRALQTALGLLRIKQAVRLDAASEDLAHAAVETTWRTCQDVDVYRAKYPGNGERRMTAVMDKIRHDVPSKLVKAKKLGSPLKRRSEDVLAYYGLPATSNGPTDAITRRLGHLRGTVLGF